MTVVERNLVAGVGPLFDPSPPGIVRPAEDLAALAAEINAEYAAGVEALERGLGHFRAVGLALLKVKALLPHGEFSPWVAKNVPCNERQGQRYMRLAKADAASDLKELWRIICGHAPASDGEGGYVAEDRAGCAAAAHARPGQPEGRLDAPEGAGGPPTQSAADVDADAYRTDDDAAVPPGYWQGAGPAEPPRSRRRRVPNGEVVAPAGSGDEPVDPEPDEVGDEEEQAGEGGGRQPRPLSVGLKKGLQGLGAVCSALSSVGLYDQHRRALQAIKDDLNKALRAAGGRPSPY